MIPKPESCRGCPLREPPYGKAMGFSLPCGTGLNGVMIVAEALGEQEEKEGKGLIGKSGYALFQQLKRVGIDRDDFTIHNVLSCRPPDNKLVKQPYESAAIAHCAPNLDRAIMDAKAIAKANGKTFVIVTLGVTAFKRVMGYDYRKDADLLKKDYYAYPFWSDSYSCWVYNAPHPSYLNRGNTHFWPVVQFVFKRALEVANDGLTLDEPNLLLDPSPTLFDSWIDGYHRSLVKDPSNPLSYDIETPYKKKVKDEEEIGKDESADHTITRVGFSYRDAEGRYHTTSVKWSAEYVAGIERLFTLANFVLGWNSDKYDYPRVSRYVRIRGIGLDGMVAWHILNTSLLKRLGFVTPFYWQTTLAWKYLADKEPALYNAKDALAALICWFGIKRDLQTGKLWDVYERGWIELSKALKYMTGVGVLRDNDMRDRAEATMSSLLDDIEARMEESVPRDAREIKIYKKAPATIKPGMFELSKDFPVKYCGTCGIDLTRKWAKHAKLCKGAGNTTVLIEEAKLVWGEPLLY